MEFMGIALQIIQFLKPIRIVNQAITVIRNRMGRSRIPPKLKGSKGQGFFLFVRILQLGNQRLSVTLLGNW